MLYVGGHITSIDGFPVYNIAKWTGGSYVDNCSAPNAINEIVTGSAAATVFPNPFSISATLQTTVPLHHATLRICNLLGATVMHMENLSGTTVTLSREGLSNGMYFYHLSDSHGPIGSGKLLLE